MINPIDSENYTIKIELPGNGGIQVSGPESKQVLGLLKEGKKVLEGSLQQAAKVFEDLEARAGDVLQQYQQASQELFQIDPTQLRIHPSVLQILEDGSITQAPSAPGPIQQPTEEQLKADLEGQAIQAALTPNPIAANQNWTAGSATGDDTATDRRERR